jgi:hypothetical protein
MSLPAGVSGKVVNISMPLRQQDQTGQWVYGRTVTYQLSSGLSGSVFVPSDGFTQDAVRAAVVADATKLHQASQVTF